MEDTDFTERINELQNELSRLEKDALMEKTSPENKLLVMGLLTPVLLAILLYFTPLSMKTQPDGTKVFDKIRLAIWTVVFSIPIWLGLYGYNVYFNSE